MKRLVAGAVSAVITAISWLLLTIVLQIATQLAGSSPAGSGGIGFLSVGSGSVLVAALLGFAAGWYRQGRRST